MEECLPACPTSDMQIEQESGRRHIHHISQGILVSSSPCELTCLCSLCTFFLWRVDPAGGHLPLPLGQAGAPLPLPLASPFQSCSAFGISPRCSLSVLHWVPSANCSKFRLLVWVKSSTTFVGGQKFKARSINKNQQQYRT